MTTGQLSTDLAPPGIRAGSGLALNPDYGQGALRRRIRLERLEGYVLAELEDHAHAMKCKVHHDGTYVTAIEPDFHRVPMSTCAGAYVPLQSLIGLPHDIDTKTFFADGRARSNCTHMLDLSWLAMRHIRRQPATRLYAVDVTDERQQLQMGTVTLDGIHRWTWQIEKGDISDAPPPFVGRALFGGFTAWAINSLTDDDLEAAIVLQKAFLIATARRFILPPGPLGEREIQANRNACFGYGAERVTTAVRSDEPLRDFTLGADRLLRFL